MVFEGEAHIGNGSIVYVDKYGTLVLGDDFKISASSAIICYNQIEFGRNIQFSWDCLVMDSDTHSIFGEDSKLINENKPIVFGNDIWICCRCTILKGSVIPGNNVIGATSLVSGTNFETNSIIVGSPAKSVKKIGYFRY